MNHNGTIQIYNPQWYITYDRNHSQHFPFWEITWTMAVQCSVENRHSQSKTINRFLEVIADEYYCIRVKVQFYCTTIGEALPRLKVTAYPLCYRS